MPESRAEVIGWPSSSAQVSVFIELLAVNEFTIGPMRTPQELDLACRFLLRIFPSLEARWPGQRFFRERLADQSYSGTATDAVFSTDRS
jgi:hypothetical protein